MSCLPNSCINFSNITTKPPKLGIIKMDSYYMREGKKGGRKKISILPADMETQIIFLNGTTVI